MASTSIHPLTTVNQHNIIPLLNSYRMMPKLLRERVIDNAIASIECTPTEIDLAFKEFFQSNKINSEIELQIWLKSHSMTITQLELTVMRSLKVKKFKQQTWGERLEAYFWQRKSDLDLAIYSTIKVKNKDLAQELFFRIYEGEQTFAEVASQYSQGIEAHTGGVMNPVGIGRLPKPLVQILRHSKPGEICRPVTFDNWTIIARLEKIIPAQLNQITAQSLLNEMFESWLQKQINILENRRKSNTQLTPVLNSGKL